ncbi:small ubiquitin-related modifier 3-like isoform X2 [Penaeus japonicus]|uniref:small ubiquitin-related modifier 3-like isoform X2 n=1 Tax=Penaeus japonicus TaxID=27405 RepID=UPI001C70BB99|nr:small ubiquitin-related modifier 3-like isoform X2 [Penaeus japonicus]
MMTIGTYVMPKQKEEKPSEHINLKVVGQDGQVVHFKIKKHTSLKKLINAYCERSKLVQTTVRFRFDGQPITENDTPQGLEMEDGDTIEVFQQQTGGSFPSHLVLL